MQVVLQSKLAGEEVNLLVNEGLLHLKGEALHVEILEHGEVFLEGELELEAGTHSVCLVEQLSALRIEIHN